MIRFILIFIAGMHFPSNSYAGLEFRDFQDFQFRPQNQTHVLPQRRAEPVTASILSVGKVLLSAWKTIGKQTSLKLQITNQLKGDMKSPQWYSLHGHAAMLPPPLISQGEKVTEIQFDKTSGGNQGAEGALAYDIGNDKGKPMNLIIMWRVPQFGIYEDISYFAKIEEKEINKQSLIDLFAKRATTWKKAEENHQYFSETVGPFTVRAAMGNRNVVTLRVIVSS